VFSLALAVTLAMLVGWIGQDEAAKLAGVYISETAEDPIQCGHRDPLVQAGVSSRPGSIWGTTPIPPGEKTCTSMAFKRTAVFIIV